MSRRKITQEELEGFSLAKYTGLPMFSYKQWRDLIFHRRLLWDMAAHLRSTKIPPDRPVLAQLTDIARSQAANCAASLLENPLGSVLPLPPQIDLRHALETTFIRLVPQEYKGPLPPHADPLSGDLFGTLDGVPLNQPFVGADPTSRRVLLEVDLGQDDGSLPDSLLDSLLLADFKKWLMHWRLVSGGEVRKNAAKEDLPGVQSEIDRWLKRRLIPYIDLKLVARLIGKDFGAGTLEALLKDNTSPDGWEKDEKWLKRHLGRFLSQSWLDVMTRMAFEESVR
ncbi:DUF6387 family protein [Cupriavidus campinensis]|uniref:DUF6387 family protein n=1 Tax=Cupriavidus campinensis TaxID=151783 RepID=A0AAE9I1X2_9BURK|nr:DUF6387 family protein [Cupriavidus campinensis]URF05063.1 DUF6387 family protein [Cupriavidus campinensis]